MLFLEKREDQVQIILEVVKAVVRNRESIKEVIILLLEEREDQVQIILEVIEVVARN
jgi:hypothetical protein